MRPPGTPDIQVHVWDAGPGSRPYFTVRQAEPGGQPSRMLYSEAVAGPGGRPQNQRAEPFPRPDYTDPATGVQYRQGHGADHADTRATFGPTDATGDPMNFSPQTALQRPAPEPDRAVVADQQLAAHRRAQCGAGPNPVYREITYYGPNVTRTANPNAAQAGAGSGTAIPEGVYFIVADQNGVARFVWQVRTADAPVNFATGAGSNAANSQRFAIPLEQVPLPVRWASGFQWTAAGTAVEDARETVSGTAQ